MGHPSKLVRNGGVSGNVIVLNGTSSAGKTTLAKAIQTAASEPYQLFAFDQFRDGLPDRYRGLNSPEGSPGSAGLNVIAAPADGDIKAYIMMGSHGLKMLNGMHQAIASFARSGHHVIVDHYVNHQHAADDLVAAFDGLKTTLVRVVCDHDELMRRESSRPGRFPGTAETQSDIMNTCFAYDITVDSTHQSASELAVSVLNFVAQ